MMTWPDKLKFDEQDKKEKEEIETEKEKNLLSPVIVK